MIFRCDSDSSHSRKPLDISAGRHEDTLFVVNFREDTTAAMLKEMFGEVRLEGLWTLFGLPSCGLNVNLLTSLPAPIFIVWYSAPMHNGSAQAGQSTVFCIRPDVETCKFLFSVGGFQDIPGRL